MNTKTLITQSLNNSLSDKDKKAFDALLESDVEFAKEVTFQQSLQKVIAKEEYATLKTHLQSLENSKSTTNYKKWLVAASIVLLVGFSSLWFLNSEASVSSQELYAQNFEPYRNVIKPIVRGEMDDTLETTAFTAYETKDYDKALILFNKMLDENDSEITKFYKANVLLQLDKTEEAIVIFKQNTNLKGDWKAKNSWYLAMAYLKADDVENAKKQLEILANNQNNTFKKSTVKKLLEKLD
ncbi:MAG: hypothetical protein L3J14_05565 [Flavobacteriaceae bacterium]|nr:hypothetical protein [Flavobacteriaceae bacterium]